MPVNYTWVSIAAFAVFAVYTTHSQLNTFKKRCAVKPDTKTVGVEQTTEDAIKLETLQALARGVNPELRIAALKIITERALRESTLDYLVRQIDSDDASVRLRALKALKVLMQNASHKRLLLPELFRALVGALRKARAMPNGVPLESRGEREAIYIMTRLIQFAQGHQFAVEAGIVDWLMDYKVPGYPNIIVAVFDPSYEPSESSFYELLSGLCEDGTPGRRLIQDSGMVRDIRRSNRSDTQWVEVEIDADDPDGVDSNGVDPNAESREERRRAWLPPPVPYPLEDLLR